MKLKYYKGSILFSILGVLGGSGIGYLYGHTLEAALSAAFLTFVLAILEISLSFDNAVVNAAVLKRMTPEWRHRFITWGILIAVFGMRIVFPLVIVSILANVTPWGALVMATTQPDQYAKTMLDAHVTLAGFGGAFLLMVALKYFFDANKDVHWVSVIEKPLSSLGKVEAIELGMSLLVLYFISTQLSTTEAHSFLLSGVFGLVTFIAVDGVASLLEAQEESAINSARASFGLFMYLEILDASFSFDGVVGAFALTHNLFIIAIGLGIGAMFVRSMTIMLVEEGTLAEYRYLEHGAFYAIAALAIMMLFGTILHIPETVTGLIGAGFIGLALYSSIQANKLKS